MTDYLFDEEGFRDIQNSRLDAEALSELLEQESRRYSRQLEREDEVIIR